MKINRSKIIAYILAAFFFLTAARSSYGLPAPFLILNLATGIFVPFWMRVGVLAGAGLFFLIYALVLPWRVGELAGGSSPWTIIRYGLWALVILFSVGAIYLFAATRPVQPVEQNTAPTPALNPFKLFKYKLFK